MAKTSLSKAAINRHIVEALAKEFRGRTFAPKSLNIGRRADLLPSMYEFDAVSDDGTIVALVDNRPWLSRKGEKAASRVADLYQKLYFLSLAWAEIKLLVFTNRDAFLGFGQESDGKLAKGVRLHQVDFSRQP